MTVCINLGGSHEILRLPSEPLKKVGWYEEIVL